MAEASCTLIGVKQIAARFGAPKSAVAKWKKAGAPIIVFNSGAGARYCADYHKLYEWLCRCGAGRAGDP